MSEQKELTKAELQIMQVLWRKENAFVNEILQDLEEPRPAYNTVSTVLRVLQNKGFVAYRSFGKNYQYYPLVSKESYTNRFMNRVVDNFFSGSVTGGTFTNGNYGLVTDGAYSGSSTISLSAKQ